jgi:hypothetical protein
MADTDSLPDDQQEGLEDVGGNPQAYQAAINQSDWTVETIVQQIKKGNIELNPGFQRREAWLSPRKSKYIESLIMQIPVPQIVLAEKKDKKGQFVVIDGKQRLIALRQFASDDKIGAYAPYFLEGLAEKSELNGKGYHDFQVDPSLCDERDAFDNATVRTVVIRNWKDEDFLYTVFLRLNTGSLQLSPQELRQALHPGPFAEFVDRYSSESEKLHDVMGIKKADPRMRDAELVLRYVAFRNHLPSYAGNMKSILDQTTKNINKDWANRKPSLDAQISDFEAAIDTTVAIFGLRDAFRKWSGGKFESALNRAVFDVMILYFSNSDTAKVAIDNKDAVKYAFKTLCEQSDDFRSAIEGTTKSIPAVFNRLSLWADALSSAIGKPVEKPVLDQNNRIQLAI